jgi:hypothetical protein
MAIGFGRERLARSASITNVRFTASGRSIRAVNSDVAVAAGPRPKNKALEWLKKFSFEKKRLLIYQVQEDWFAYGPPAFQSEILQRIERGEKPWAD